MTVNEWIGVVSFALSILIFLWKAGSTLNRTLDSLEDAIDRLNENLNESKKDRDKLHARADVADTRLDNHDVRLHVLEDWRKGIKQ